MVGGYDEQHLLDEVCSLPSRPDAGQEDRE